MSDKKQAHIVLNEDISSQLFELHSKTHFGGF